MRTPSLGRFLEPALPRIRVLGLMLFDPVWAERWHHSVDAELLHVTRGAVRLEMKRGSFLAKPGDLLLIPPGVEHRDRFDLKEGLELFFCTFQWPPIRAFCAQVNNRHLLALPEGVKSEIRFLIDQLRADRKGLSGGERWVNSGRLLSILLLLLRAAEERGGVSSSAAKPAGPSRRRELMQQAKLFLDQHYDRPMTLDDIAGALGVSPYHLSHVFSEESDFSLFAYLTLVRMNKARVLLRERRMSVAGVAQAVGYEDPHYFARVFHRHAGCTPREFAGRREAAHEPRSAARDGTGGEPSIP